MKVIHLNKYIESEHIFVTDHDVENIINLRESREQLKRRLAEVEDSLILAEEAVIQRLEVGAKVQAKYPLEIKTRERYFPSWKDAFLSRLGETEAAKVMAQTPPRVYKSLLILK